MQAAEMQRKIQADELRKQLQQAQIGNYESDAEYRKGQALKATREAEAAIRQQQEQRSILAQFAGGATPGFRDASIAAGGTPPPGYTPPTGQVRITPEVAARWVAAGGNLDTLQKLAESGNFGRQEVARVLEERGPDGLPLQVREDRYGGRIGAPVPKPFEMRMTDTGGSVVPVNPYAPTALTKTQSPDSIASNATTRRGQDMTDRRAGAEGGRPVWSEELRSFVYRPNSATPNGAVIPVLGQDGKPIPPKPPEKNRSEVQAIDAEIQSIQGARKGVEKTPSAFGFERGVATLSGGVAESVRGRFDSTEEREARAYVFNVVSKTINERAGAAQTAQELARLRSFLPAETDRADQIADKLAGYEQYLRDRRRGFEVPGIPDSPTPLPGPRKTDAPKSPSFGMLPPAKDYDGKTATDTQTGKKFRSENGKWVPLP
jgi:hypothetical protein